MTQHSNDTYACLSARIGKADPLAKTENGRVGYEFLELNWSTQHTGNSELYTTPVLQWNAGCGSSPKLTETGEL